MDEQAQKQGMGGKWGGGRGGGAHKETGAGGGGSAAVPQGQPLQEVQPHIAASLRTTPPHWQQTNYEGTSQPPLQEQLVAEHRYQSTNSIEAGCRRGGGGGGAPMQSCGDTSLDGHGGRQV